MPDKMGLDYLKLLYCEFQKYEVMTMSVVGGQAKKHANPNNKTHWTHFSNLWLLPVIIFVLKHLGSMQNDSSGEYVYLLGECQ